MLKNNLKCTKCSISLANDFKPCWRNGEKNDILFIGEAPGHTENKTKIPFTGKTGKFLRKMIRIYQLENMSSFTNIIKCQPTRNRDPNYEEITNCKSYLFEDIAVVKPRLVILLGRVALETFVGHPIQVVKPYINKPFVIGKAIFLPIYHPSYILRDELEEDYFKSFNVISDIYSQLNPYYFAKKYRKKRV